LEWLKRGTIEADVAARVAGQLTIGQGDAEEGQPVRAGGHVAVMSGARAGKAYGAYALSSGKQLGAGELVMVHCNSVREGFWTDVTRTVCIGGPTGRQEKMFEAVSEARAAALAAIRPGVTGAEVDRAARGVMERRGFGEQFKHPTGHGVGYAAIDHNARPRLHPKSDDVLEEGMVFNVEPAVYFEGEEGMRHCDVVVCTRDGAEVLTPFMVEREALVVSA
jgi:Xaa-Pro aminopeptidase